MAAGVLGRAIARAMGAASGRFYVQLPQELRAEAIAFATQRNTERAWSAIVVASRGAQRTDPEWVVRPEDLLAWRTAEDRAFVILGGAIEPDSSFATSAVPFLNSAFPGAGGGVLTTAELAAATIDVALAPAKPRPEVLESFRNAAPWILRMLGYGLRSVPRPTKDWGQTVLEVWAEVASELEDSAKITNGAELRCWDAWELVRICGFPRPLFGRATTEIPPHYEEVDDRKLSVAVDVWQHMVEDYVRSGEASAILERLAASSPIPGTRRWSALDWSGASKAAQRFSASPPEIGRQLFHRMGPLRDPTEGTANSWQAVSIEDLNAAMSEPGEAPRLVAGRGFLPVGDDDSPWLLDTRAAFVGTRAKGKLTDQLTFAAELSVEGLRTLPEGSVLVEHGHLIGLVEPALKPKTGMSVELRAKTIVEGRLQLALGITVDARVRSGAPVRWSPIRRLVLDVNVQDVVGGVRQPVRNISLVSTIIVPSPYWPTVVAPTLDGPPVSPAADVQFSASEGTSELMPLESPELVVERAGTARLLAYDGRWHGAQQQILGPSEFSYSAGGEPSPASGFDFATLARVADEAVVDMPDDQGLPEATVIRVENQAPLPTTPLQRDRAKAALGDPSRAQREAPLGVFQTAVADTLSKYEWNSASLGQLVIASGLGEAPHVLAFGRLPTAAPGAEGPWPGLGHGPSEHLAAKPEWARFLAAASEVAGPALRAGTPNWLSSIDLSSAQGATVRGYLEAHRALVQAADGAEDKFWTKFPFCVFLVQGGRGPERGTLQSIFLSPMHPVRLGWLFGAQLHAEALVEAPRIRGLIDGWNYPAAAEVPGPGGIAVRLVALPLDPGIEGDMTPWSALVPANQHGIVRPPLLGAGRRLPWGGRSGLNEQVVKQSLDDYRRAHPFLSSLQIELRTAVEAPRSMEVDRAVLAWASANAEELGGSVRILDNLRRLGEPPTRDSLPERPPSVPKGRFAWTVLERDDEVPGPVDVAFVENAAPFTHVVQGRLMAPVAPLSVRRFSVAVEVGDHVEYQHAGNVLDLLGLARLLDVVEPPAAATRVVFTLGSIQAGAEVRWEVIGDINMEPSQIARVAAVAGDGKQLWEWRPGWVDEGGGAVRGAHYVIAKAPRSLVAGLQRNLGLEETQAAELLSELGSRGVGLATLRRPGSSQEGEAAGLFYAARLLAGFQRCKVPPTWLPAGCLAGLVPLDPLDGVIQALSNEKPSDTRADLGLVIVRLVEGRPAALKIVPIECKHRGTAAGPAARPSTSERGRAAKQATASCERLQRFQGEIAVASGRAGLLQASGRLQAFAALVDLALKFGPDEPSPELRAQVVQDILEGEATLELGAGVVVWSMAGRDAPGVQPLYTAEREDGLLELELAPAAAQPLVWSGHPVDARHIAIRAGLDGFLAPKLDVGHGLPLHAGLRDALALALGLSDDGSQAAVQGESSPVGRPSSADGSAGAAASLASDSAVTPAQAGPRGGEEPRPLASVGDTPAPQDDYSPAEPGLPEPEDPASVGAVGREPAADDAVQADLFLGAEASNRFAIVGKLSTSGQVVALDLDHPKALGVFGYMGSGKSYLLGNLIESAAIQLPGLNALRSPLCVVVFNYRRNAADRFELSSLTHLNDEPSDVLRLDVEYGAKPGRLQDLRVLCLPGELRSRGAEYEGASTGELYFKPSLLDVEDWELLMGEPGSDAVFARTIRTSLQELRRRGEITVQAVRDYLSERLQKASLAAAELRLESLERIVSEEHGVDFGDFLAPGRVVVIDLRQPMFNRDDAMKLILVCASQIAKQRTAFNKLVVFDEAHEYMTEAFGERFDARIRYMRHEGSSYVFATQDVASVPVEIRRHLGINFVFSLETRDNINDMAKASPELAGLQLQHLDPGTCYVTSSKSTGNLFRSPRLLRVRPRATRHGGKSRIFHQDD